MLLALGIGAAVCATTAPVVHADRGTALNIVGIQHGMTVKQVVARLGPPRARKAAGNAVAWHYPDRLVVFIRRKGAKQVRKVVGVRTRSPKDKVKPFPDVHVGAPARRLRRKSVGADCFRARVADPGGRLIAGRFCTWPVYVEWDDELEEFTRQKGRKIKGPLWLFRIEGRKIVSVTLQIQPRRRPLASGS